MNQLRLNPLNGRWVTVATGRSSRPTDLVGVHEAGAPTSSEPCPFCPGNEEATPPALVTYGDDGQWRLRVVPNRYPAFEGTEAMEVEHLGPVFAQAPASGLHEVLILSPDHDRSWADLDDDEVHLVMAALQERFADHEARPTIRYSQAILNHGRSAGASLAHPHGQLLGIPFVPGEILDELAGFRRFSGGCLLCATVQAELDAGHRVVERTDQATVIAPFWSGSPFELLVIPNAHSGHLHRSEPDTLAGIGRSIRDVLARLRDRLGDVDHNLVVHTLPHRSEDPFHWHVHVVPRLHSTGGFEQGTGVPIDIVAPEDVAGSLGVTAV